MAKKNHTKKETKNSFLFGRTNYTWMLVGIACIAIGFILMAGGGNTDPNIFDESIYNFRRIRLAPTLIIIGFSIEIYAILTTAKVKK